MINAETDASWRSIKMSVLPAPEARTVYSPAGSVLPPATKSKGTLTAIAFWACATRVVAIAVSAITAAITKALVFMGQLLFLVRCRRPSFTSFRLVRLPCQRLNMLHTFSYSAAEDNARRMNCQATVGEQVSAGK